MATENIQQLSVATRGPVIAPGEGTALIVRAGQVVRVRQAPGGAGQAGDLNFWNLTDPREHFWGARTAVHHGMHVTTGDQLHSTWPGERPIVTIVADTLAGRRSARGALHHDVVLGRCSQKYRRVRYGKEKETPGCQEILAVAIEPFGLRPDHVHDAFNVFTASGVDSDDRFFLDANTAGEADYLELRAEIDLLLAIAACPGSVLRVPHARGLEYEIRAQGGHEPRQDAASVDDPAAVERSP